MHVSRKKRVNKNDIFGFVRFASSEEVEKTAKINNGLMIKGFKMVATLSKFNRQSTSRKDYYQSNSPERAVRQIWKPSKRDGRTYSEVAQRVVYGQQNSPLQEWLEKAYICSDKEVLDVKQVMEKINGTEMKDIYFYKLDDFSVIVYKCDEHSKKRR